MSYSTCLLTVAESRALKPASTVHKRQDSTLWHAKHLGTPVLF